MPPPVAAPWRLPVFWADIRPQVWSALGLSPAVYTDDSFFADEQTRLFGRAWTGVALADEGVLVAVGDVSGGYVLYLAGGRLVFEYCYLG